MSSSRMSSHYNARVGAHFKSDALSGRVYIEHDADRVNDFLVSVGVARTQIWPVQFCARARDFTGLSSFFCNSKTPLHGPVDRSATAKPRSRLASAASGSRARVTISRGPAGGRPARYAGSGADFAGVSEPPGRTMSVEVPCARRRSLAST